MRRHCDASLVIRLGCERCTRNRLTVKLIPMRIALLEDDPEQAAIVTLWLTEAGHSCRAFARGRDFTNELARESYDLCLVDWQVPDLSGLEVLRWIRQRITNPLPVLFVTARDQEADIVEALTAGADDYLVKPLRRLEFLARIGVLARRHQAALPQADSFVAEPFNFDLKTRKLTHADQPIAMTPKDFDVALFLFRNAERLLSRGHLFEAVWGKTVALDTRTVDTHISRVRRKLGLKGSVAEGGSGWRLISVYQHGYRLETAN